MLGFVAARSVFELLGRKINSEAKTMIRRTEGTDRPVGNIGILDCPSDWRANGQPETVVPAPIWSRRITPASCADTHSASGPRSHGVRKGVDGLSSCGDRE